MQLGTWLADRMTDWATDWLTVQLGTWPADRMTDWATDLLTVQLGTWLADRMTDWAADWLCSWVPDWLTEWLIEQLTEWLTKLSNLPSYWLTATNWLTDLGTDWGLQSRGQFNKTFTSVIYKCIHCLESVNHALNKWTSLLHSNELQFSVFLYRGFW